MDDIPLYPLSFRPIFKDYVWGGRRLAQWFPAAPAKGPIAEAWLVSDEAANPSVVADGPLKGWTLHDLVRGYGSRLLGQQPPTHGRFPVLLKFLDAAEALSVQVHPTDEQAAKLGPDMRGKTEAWVVMHAEAGGRIYAGLQPGVDATHVRQALASKKLPDCLRDFEPVVGDCVFLPAGTVHALGAGLLIFEVQQTSDITYRLYDWDRIDANTHKGRPLHIDEGLASTNFVKGPCTPVQPTVESREPIVRERLVDCPYFRLWRMRGDRPFPVGANGECRIIIGVAGENRLTVASQDYDLRVGGALLLPAEVGAGWCQPLGSVTVLECGLAP